MKRILIAALVAALTVISFVSTSSPSFASTAPTITVYCDGVVASGPAPTGSPFVGFQIFIPAIIDSNNGPAFLFVPVSGGLFSLSYSFPARPVGTMFTVQVYGSTGAKSANNWDHGQTYSVKLACAGSMATASAQVPGAFVLRTITCNTPVYDSAGGNPVTTGEGLTTGQTWFVNPNPVTVGKQSWTEFFDAGWINGFIPTACIGAKPAGYLGA